MRKKLKSRRGVTIIEMLVALIVLSLLTAGGVSATSAVMADYNRMQDAANAEILASTVIETISNEIRLGKDITVTGTDSLAFGESAFSGEGATIQCVEGHLVSKTGSSTRQMLSEDAYSGLQMKDLHFEQVSVTGTGTKDRTVFTISFSVFGPTSGTLWTGKASAAPLVD